MIDHEALAPMIQRNAGVVRRQYPSAEHGDLQGVQWEWAYENQDKVKNFLDSNSPGLLSNRLMTIAQRWAAKERELDLGRDPDDLFVYTTRSVGELLKDVFEYEGWQHYEPNGGDGMPTARGLANQTGDRMAMLSDVSAALKQIPEEQYNVLVWTYKYGYSHAKLASVLEITEDASRQRVSRAVRKLVNVLMGQAPSTSEGADPEYVGTRKVITNAQARASTSSQWDE